LGGKGIARTLIRAATLRKRGVKRENARVGSAWRKVQIETSEMVRGRLAGKREGYCEPVLPIVYAMIGKMQLEFYRGSDDLPS